MIFVIIFFSMIVCHIVDDYYLQGCLAKMKQKKWWEENYPNQKYDGNHIAALLCHAFSWSFMIHLPITIFIFCKAYLYEKLELIVFFCISIALNLIIHALIDDLKANKLKINLGDDQFLHLLQITITFIVFMIIINC